MQDTAPTLIILSTGRLSYKIFKMSSNWIWSQKMHDSNGMNGEVEDGLPELASTAVCAEMQLSKYFCSLANSSKIWSLLIRVIKIGERREKRRSLTEDLNYFCQLFQWVYLACKKRSLNSVSLKASILRRYPTTLRHAGSVMGARSWPSSWFSMALQACWTLWNNFDKDHISPLMTKAA